MTRYAKALAALLTGLGVWGAAALADEQVSQAEAWTLLGVLGQAVAVWYVKNTPPAGEARQPDISEANPA